MARQNVRCDEAPGSLRYRPKWLGSPVFTGAQGSGSIPSYSFGLRSWETVNVCRSQGTHLPTIL